MTEAETALSTRPTFHLSPLTYLPQNLETQEESKVAQMRVSVSTHGELKASSMQERKKERGRENTAKGGTARVLTFVQGYRKEDIFQFKSMLNESGSSCWPAASSLEESHEPLASSFEI